MRCVLSMSRASNLPAEEFKHLLEFCFELFFELLLELDFELDIEDLQLRFDKERRDPPSDAPLELPLAEGGRRGTMMLLLP